MVDAIIAFVPGPAVQSLIPTLMEIAKPVVWGSTGFEWPSDIDEQLKRFARAGIPLYVLYGPEGQTEVFPEVITPNMLADVFEANELSLRNEQ